MISNALDSNLSTAREPWKDLHIWGYLYHTIRRLDREVTKAIQGCNFSTLFGPLMMIPAPKDRHPLAKHYRLTKINSGQQYSAFLSEVPHLVGPLEHPALEYSHPPD